MNKRRFDTDLPVFKGRYALIPDTEDRELSAFLEKRIKQIFSKKLHPVVCPHCGHRSATLRYRGKPPSGIPYFNCNACGRGFNRRTGTALQGFREKDKLPVFIRLLSQQRPVEDAVRALDVSPAMIARWVRVFRQWLLEIDLSGYWESKVRLGIRPDIPDIECRRCGSTTGFWRYGFYYSAATGEQLSRQYRCQNCGSVNKIRIGDMSGKGGRMKPVCKSI